MIKQRAAQAAPLRVCIFSNDKSSCEGLALDATRANYRVAGVFNDPAGLIDFISGSALDHIVLLDMSDHAARSLELIKKLSAKRPLPIVVATSGSDGGLAARAIEAGAQEVLVRPFDFERVAVAFSVAVQQQAKQARLEGELERLRAKLEERKLIERAKGILMKSAAVSEMEAYKLMQRESQDRRRPMAEIASGIISAAELIKHAAQEKC
ncbi:MAG TPA: ANTAR domain-containing protein [Blastocatellia bacterium]|nr:ANTAR domain-containing protein [Blastocatellia bacterium]